MQPKVSVIIPFLNGLPYLADCVRSVQQQTLREIEIILVDDGSTDGSEALADTLAAEDDRIRVLHQANSGVSTARNNALAVAKGTYIGFVDADDLAVPEMYETLYNAAMENKCDIVSCAYKSFREQRTVYESPPPFPAGTVYDHDGIVEFLPYMCSKPIFSYIWRRLFSAELIRSNAIRFDPQISIGEDTLFCIRCFLCAARVIALPDRLYRYRHHGDSAMRSRKYKPNLSPSLIRLYAEQKEICRTFCPEKESLFLRESADRFYHGHVPIMLGNVYRKPQKKYSEFRRLVRSEPFRDMFRYFDLKSERSRSLDWIQLRLVRLHLYLPAYLLGKKLH